MCTLIVLHRCMPGSPLVVAANRDEFLDRPAEAPALRSTTRGRIVAPLDLEAGGTWVGVSERGVFAGLTNLRPVSEASEASQTSQASEETDGSASGPDDHATIVRASEERKKRTTSALRSRGEVVMKALESKSAAAAIDALSRLESETYNPFQLLVADGREAWLAVYRGSTSLVELDPGPHIVGNVVGEQTEAAIGVAPSKITADEEPRSRKLTRIRERVEKMMTEPGLDPFEGLARICREHVEFDRDGDPRGDRESPSLFESTCVHVAGRYGTRSSLLLELSTDPVANRLWTTDGPPCERPFENRSFLLRELDVRLGDRADTNDVRKNR